MGALLKPKTYGSDDSLNESSLDSINDESAEEFTVGPERIPVMGRKNTYKS